MNTSLNKKYEKLKSLLESYGSLAVAFSGGVDSTLLLKVAHDVLQDRVIAVTAVSEFIPRREKEEADAFCKAEGIRHLVLKAEELTHPEIAANPKNRCYLCKHLLFSGMQELAEKNGIHFVAEGSNMDDLGDYRPGLQAIKELGILSPLREAELTKSEIRELSRELALPTFAKPSFACLASRFVYGETLTAKKLAMVEEAEQLLIDLGFSQMRVRVHGDMARIEVLPEDIRKVTEPKIREQIERTLSGLGFSYVTLDLKGFRSGSMNETLKSE